MITVLKITCMHCGCDMGEKDGKGVSGISHGICRECWTARFPDWPYPKDEPELIRSDRTTEKPVEEGLILCLMSIS